MVSSINSKEMKYIFMAIAFAFAVFTLAIPRLINQGVENSNPFFQFFLFNIGFFIFLQIFLKSQAGGSKINISGALGLMALFLAMDCFIGPYLVDFNGNLQTGVTLAQSATDYIMGTIAINLGLTGHMIFIFTYVIAPAILLFISAKLLPNFVRHV